MSAITYRNPPSPPRAGDVLFAPAPAVLPDAPDVWALVRVLAVDSSVVTRMQCAWVKPLAASTAEPVLIAVDCLQVQVGADGAPTHPTRVVEDPDRPATHIAYPSGIDMARVGAGGADAVMARPAVLEADSQQWQLSCPSCPLAAAMDGPQMLCAWGTRVGSGFVLRGNCPHSRGMRKSEDSTKRWSACAFTGVPGG